MQMTKIRIRATGQVTEMIPNVARAMIASGAGEEVKSETPIESAKIETATITTPPQKATAPAQDKPKKKTAR